MLLAAGRGDRLRPLTDATPKPLIEVGGKSLIAHLIGSLVRAGHTEIVINHSWLGEQIENTVGSGDAYGAKVTYSPEPGGALETGGGIMKALPLLGERPFVAVNADIFTDYPFASLPPVPEGLAHLVVVGNPRHNPEGDFALDGTQLRNRGTPKFTFSGIGVYRPALFAGKNPGRFSLTPLLRAAADGDQLSGEYHGGVWWDTGTPERLQALRQSLVTGGPK